MVTKTPEEWAEIISLAKEAADELIRNEQTIGDEFGPWGTIPSPSLVNRLRALAGEPPVQFDKWGCVIQECAARLRR